MRDYEIGSIYFPIDLAMLAANEGLICMPVEGKSPVNQWNETD